MEQRHSSVSAVALALTVTGAVISVPSLILLWQAITALCVMRGRIAASALFLLRDAVAVNDTQPVAAIMAVAIAVFALAVSMIVVGIVIKVKYTK